MQVAARAAHAKLETTGSDAPTLLRDLDTLITVQGEPFGSTSIYAQRRVFELAHECGVTVMLDGQGADEMFGGYRSVVSARCASLLGKGRLGASLQLARNAGRLPGDLGAGWFLARAATSFVPRPAVAATRRLLRQELTPVWMSSEWFHDKGVAVTPTLDKPSSLSAALTQQMAETSLPSILRYEDRNSMAFSIESRVPFLTIPLVEFAMSIPEEHLIGPDGMGKRVLREAVRPFVPSQLVDRRDKIGFATPEKQWLAASEEWVAQLVRGAATVQALRPEAVWDEYRGVVAGTRRFDWHLWRCLNLIRWAEIFDVTWES
jgi:asparagine synthase (glutamine-hydrolysing)